MKEIDDIEDSENIDKIKIISSEDEKLKILGELLSNKSSRDIIKLLMNKKMYTNEIATKLDIRISLVIHHLRKLEELELLEITHKSIVRKGNKHRYFKMIPNLFLLPTQSKEEIHKNGFLKKFFKDGIKFVAVFLVVITGMSIFLKENITKPGEIINDNDSIVPDIDIVKIPIEILDTFSYESIMIIIPVLAAIVIVSSVIFIFLKKKKKRVGFID